MTDYKYNKLNNKRILITGANGFIGREIVRRLLELNESDKLGIRVTALVRDPQKASERFSAELDRSDLEFLVGDVCNEETFSGREWDLIIHAASNSHPLSFAKLPYETMLSNLKGTMNLLDVVRRCKSCRMLYLSTGEIYGDAVSDSVHGWMEDTKGVVDSMKVRSCYPESKRAAETLCVSFCKEYDADIVIARLGYIYGVGNLNENSRADAQFLRLAAAGENIVLKSKGEQIRSYCYIKDAIEAIITILTEGESGEAYNVANASSVITIREYAELLAEAFGVSVIFDLPDTLEQSGYSTMKKEVLNPNKLYSLGYEPRYSPIQGIEDMKRLLEGKR